jgi:acyl-CoA synthetase (AMP-forming)/AMP-acid ligase II
MYDVPKAATLPALLSMQARERGSSVAYRFLPDGEQETRAMTFAELEREARAIAARLQAESRPGDRAMILTPDAVDFVRAFLACQYAGVVAVPVYPPLPVNSPRKLETLRVIAASCQPAAVLASGMESGGPDFRPLFDGLAPELTGVPWVPVGEAAEGDPGDHRPVPVRPQDVSFLQYTSGSTAHPKGVIVTHEALMHQEELLYRVGWFTPETVFVSWLPLFHDMGLIGTVLPALYAGCQAVLMPPLAFVQRPVRWLRAIQRYRGDVAGGPNSAYDLCVRRIPLADREGLDLRSWRGAFNGAEPVRAATMEAFSEAFGPYGFDRRAWYPTYGLAECTLMATASHHGLAPVTLDVDADRLGQGELVIGGDQRLVGSGKPVLHRQMVIVDPETCRPVPEGTVGEIWLAGPDVGGGYWGLAEETERTFGARLAGTDEGPFLRTGDLGAVHDGELFVCGRLKDLIILEGRNHYPQDIESTIEAAHPAIRTGCCAVFAIEADDREQLVVVAEVSPVRGPVDPDQVTRAVRAAVATDHSVQIGQLALVAPGSVPKTSSGKIRRAACRAAFERGELASAKAGGQRQLEGAR